MIGVGMLAGRLVGINVGIRVGLEVAVGWFTWVGAIVAGKGEAGVVVWPGVQPENTLLKMATTMRMVMKWVLVLRFICPLLDGR